MLQIAKCKDIFDFGVSIFDLMIGKKDEHFNHVVVSSENQNSALSPE